MALVPAAHSLSPFFFHFPFARVPVLNDGVTHKAQTFRHKPSFPLIRYRSAPYAVALIPGSRSLWPFLLRFSFACVLVLNDGLPLKAQTFYDF